MIGERPDPGLATGWPWKTEKKTDVQWYVGRLPDGRILICIQGSISWRDWYYNFRAGVAPYKNQGARFLVHRGFAICWKSIRDQVAAKVAEQLDAAPAEIYVAAFSKGAAEGLLAAEDMAYRYGIPNVSGALYGGPRVLWKDDDGAFRKRVQNVRLWRNGSDPVPGLPPKFTGYERTSELQQIGDNFKWWKQFQAKKYHSVGAYKRAMLEG